MQSLKTINSVSGMCSRLGTERIVDLSSSVRTQDFIQSTEQRAAT